MLKSPSLSFLHFFPTPFPSSSGCLLLLPCLPFTSSLPLSHHPVAAYFYFLVFPSLLSYPFPIIQWLLTSTSLSSLHFFPTPFPLPSGYLLLLPCLPVISTPHLPFNNVFQKAVPTQDVTKLVSFFSNDQLNIFVKGSRLLTQNALSAAQCWPTS